MAIFTTVSEHLTACNAFILQTGEDIISAVQGGCGGMGSLGDTPCLSAGRKAGLASSGGEGPQPTLTSQTQSIALLDMMPGMVPPELNVSFGVMLCPPPNPLDMPSTVRCPESPQHRGVYTLTQK